MAVKTLYLKGGALQNSFQPMQDGGTAPTDAFFATATGWISGANANGSMSELRPNVNRARTTFATTPVVPTAITTGASANAFVSPTPYSGTFPAGNWTLSTSMRSAVAQPSTMRLRWRVFASTDATGATGVRELTTAVLLSGNGVGFTTTANTVMSVTWAAPAITLNNEYLFFACAQEMVTLSGTGNTRDAQFRQNSSSAVTTTNFALAQFVTDTLPLDDGATSALSEVRAPAADTLALADSVAYDLQAGGQSLQQTASDSLSLGDTTSIARSLARNVTDTGALGDNVASTRALARSAADALTLADSVASQVQVLLTKSVTDSLSLADGTSLARAFARSVVDPVSMVDSATTARVLARTVSDSTTLFDVVSTARQLNRAASDTGALADALSRSRALARPVADTMSLADALALSRVFLRPVLDALVLADVVEAAGAGQLSKSVTDTLAATDLISLSRVMSRAVSDNQVLSDSAAFSRAIARALADVLSVASFASGATSGAGPQVLEKAIYDALALVGEAQHASSMDRVAADLLGNGAMADSVGYAIGPLIVSVTPPSRVFTVPGESRILVVGGTRAPFLIPER